MQLIIKNGKVKTTHPDYIHLSQNDYPNCEIVYWRGRNVHLNDDDPRTLEQKEEYYKDQRRLEYPPVEDQLDMFYHDTLDGTTVWISTIKAIKEKYPKLKKV